MDPVRSPYGHVFERSSLQRALREGVCPLRLDSKRPKDIKKRLDFHQKTLKNHQKPLKSHEKIGETSSCRGPRSP